MATESGEEIVVDGVAVIEDVVVTDDEGEFVAEVIEVTEFESRGDFFDAEDAWADESETTADIESEDPSDPEG